MSEEAGISEEDFAVLWDMWFNKQVFADILTYKFRDINHKYNLGLVEE